MSPQFASDGLLQPSKSGGLDKNDTVEESKAATPADISPSQEDHPHVIISDDSRLSPALAAELARLRANKAQWEATLETRKASTAARLDDINRVLAKLNGSTKAQIMAADGILQRIREAAYVKAVKPASNSVRACDDLRSLPADEAASYVWARMRSFCKDHGNLRVSDLFFECDKDRSGTIDAAELTNALKRMGIEGASDKVAAAVIQTADPNGDGQLDYKELLHALKAKTGRESNALSAKGRTSAVDSKVDTSYSSTPYYYRVSSGSNAEAHALSQADEVTGSKSETNAAKAVALEARGLQEDNIRASVEAPGGAIQADYFKDEAAAASSLAQEAEDLARETANTSS